MRLQEIDIVLIIFLSVSCYTCMNIYIYIYMRAGFSLITHYQGTGDSSDDSF